MRRISLHVDCLSFRGCKFVALRFFKWWSLQNNSKLNVRAQVEVENLYRNFCMPLSSQGCTSSIHLWKSCESPSYSNASNIIFPPILCITSSAKPLYIFQIRFYALFFFFHVEVGEGGMHHASCQWGSEAVTHEGEQHYARDKKRNMTMFPLTVIVLIVPCHSHLF